MMKQSRRDILEALFKGASQLPQPAQAAYLDSACSDPGIRAEVEKMLGSASGSSGFSPSDLTGRMVGHYKVLRAIGSGGMGAVYLAEDVRLSRQVALKFLPVGASPDATRVQRFQVETRAASSLNHPNIITIYDFGEAEGLPYIVTEWIEGRTLREMISDERVPLERIVAIAAQVASALSAAHAAGIVHRDIKPENIMVRSDGYAKVLDFGLAKLTDTGAMAAASTLTNTGVVMGTVPYMSPEQVRGELLDGRTDLFSLGAVLYEMLAQRLPFQGSTSADVAAAILSTEPPQLVRQPESGQPLAQVVRKCLRKDRDLRYQTAQDLLADLRLMQSTMGTTVALPRGFAGGPSRKYRFLLPLAGLLVLVLAAGGYYWARRSNRWYQETHLTRIPGSASYSAGTLSPDGRYMAYVNLLPDSSSSLNLQLVAAGKGIELIPFAQTAYSALSFSADGNYLYYVAHSVKPGSPSALYRIPALGGQSQQIAGGVVNKIAISPDGAQVAFVRRQGKLATLFLAAADGSSEHELLRRTADFTFAAIAWTPDSRAILFAEGAQAGAYTDSSIYSVSRTGGTPRTISHPGRNFVYDLVPLPDGGGYLTNAFDPDANLQQIWFMARDGSMRHITHDLSQYRGLSASRDGQHILTSHTERRSELWVLDIDKPESARRLTEPERRYDSPTWARDGSIIASRFEAGKWMLWSIQPSGAEQPLVAQSGSELSPNACPDRDEIVFSSARKGPYAIWSVLPDGRDLKQLTPGANDQYPECIAGGTVLYWLDGTPPRKGMRVSLSGGEPEPSGELTANQIVSPDGRFVLSPTADQGTHEHRIALRTRDLSKTLASFPFSGRTSVLAWSPDSKGFVDVRVSGSAQELWYQPAFDGPARQLTHFGDNFIFAVSFSPKGGQLVCARGRFVADVLLIDNAR